MKKEQLWRKWTRPDLIIRSVNHSMTLRTMVLKTDLRLGQWEDYKHLVYLVEKH